MTIISKADILNLDKVKYFMKSAVVTSIVSAVITESRLSTIERSELEGLMHLINA